MKRLLYLCWEFIFNKNNYLKLGYDDWIDKYYNYYFNITNSIKDNDYINQKTVNS